MTSRKMSSWFCFPEGMIVLNEIEGKNIEN